MADWSAITKCLVALQGTSRIGESTKSTRNDPSQVIGESIAKYPRAVPSRQRPALSVVFCFSSPTSGDRNTEKGFFPHETAVSSYSDIIFIKLMYTAIAWKLVLGLVDFQRTLHE